jgi:hypothetical protein
MMIGRPTTTGAVIVGAKNVVTGAGANVVPGTTVVVGAKNVVVGWATLVPMTGEKAVVGAAKVVVGAANVVVGA